MPDTVNVDDSILLSTKLSLGIGAEYKEFDSTIIMHINTTLAQLSQVGVGPADGLSIKDDLAIWSLLIDEDVRLNLVKTYMYLKVRLYFDPPATSHATSAMEAQAKELEWRLNVAGDKIPTEVPEDQNEN